MRKGACRVKQNGAGETCRGGDGLGDTRGMDPTRTGTLAGSRRMSGAAHVADEFRVRIIAVLTDAKDRTGLPQPQLSFFRQSVYLVTAE